jgi:hypothetical protein
LDPNGRWNVLSEVSLCHAVRQKPGFILSNQGMAGLGTIAVQILHLAAAPKSYLDDRPTDVKGVAKSVFLPAMLPKLKNNRSSLY